MARRRADVLLVERGLFDSRAKARAALEAGSVAVDGRVLTKPAELVEEGAEIAAVPAHPYVGRGALKLVHALDLWPVAVEDRVVLDVGASTGGFTDCLLGRGASLVVALDVGHGQLHPRLRDDERVLVLERTNVRTATRETIDGPVEGVVVDVSFISWTVLFPSWRAATFCLTR